MHKVILTLAEEIDVVVRECGQETVGVRELANLTIVSLDTELIIKNLISTFDYTLKETVLAQAL
jgi:hypothetical protein